MLKDFLIIKALGTAKNWLVGGVRRILSINGLGAAVATTDLWIRQNAIAAFNWMRRKLNLQNVVVTRIATSSDNKVRIRINGFKIINLDMLAAALERDEAPQEEALGVDDKPIIDQDTYQIEFEVDKSLTLGELDYSSFASLVENGTISALSIVYNRDPSHTIQDATRQELFQTLDLFRKFSIDTRLLPEQPVEVLCQTNETFLVGNIVNWFNNNINNRVVKQSFDLMPNNGVAAMREPNEAAGATDAVTEENYQLSLARVARSKNKPELITQFMRTRQHQLQTQTLGLRNYQHKLDKDIAELEQELAKMRKQFIIWLAVIVVAIVIIAFSNVIANAINKIGFLKVITNMISDRLNEAHIFFTTSHNLVARFINNTIFKGAGYITKAVVSAVSILLNNPYAAAITGSTLILGARVHRDSKRARLAHYKKQVQTIKEKIASLQNETQQIEQQVADFDDNLQLLTSHSTNKLNLSKCTISDIQLKSMLLQLSTDTPYRTIMLPNQDFTANQLTSTLKALTHNSVSELELFDVNSQAPIKSLELNAKAHPWFVDATKTNWWRQMTKELKRNFHLQTIEFDGYMDNDVLLVGGDQNSNEYDWLRGIKSMPHHQEVYDFYRELCLNRMLNGKALNAGMQTLLFNSAEEALKQAKNKIAHNFWLTSSLSSNTKNTALNTEIARVSERNRNLQRLKDLADNTNTHHTSQQEVDILTACLTTLRLGEWKEYEALFKQQYPNLASSLISTLSRIIFDEQGLVSLLNQPLEVTERALELINTIDPARQFKDIAAAVDYFCQQVINKRKLNIERIQDWPRDLKSRIINVLCDNIGPWLETNNTKIAGILGNLDAASRQQLLAAILKLTPLSLNNQQSLTNVFNYLLTIDNPKEAKQKIHEIVTNALNIKRLRFKKGAYISSLNDFQLLVIYNQLVALSEQYEDAIPNLAAALSPQQPNSLYHFYPQIDTHDWQEELDHRLAALYTAKHPNAEPTINANFDIKSFVKAHRLYENELDTVSLAMDQLQHQPEHVLTWLVEHDGQAMDLLKTLVTNKHLNSAAIWGDILKGTIIEPKSNLVRFFQQKVYHQGAFLTKYIKPTEVTSLTAKAGGVPEIPLDHPVIATAFVLEAGEAGDDDPVIKEDFDFNIELEPKFAYLFGASLWLKSTDSRLKDIILQNLEPAFKSLRDIITFATANEIFTASDIIELIDSKLLNYPQLTISKTILDEIVDTVYPAPQKIASDTQQLEHCMDILKIGGSKFRQVWLNRLAGNYYNGNDTIIPLIWDHLFTAYSNDDRVMEFVKTSFKQHERQQKRLLRAPIITYSLMSRLEAQIFFNHINELAEEHPDDAALQAFVTGPRAFKVSCETDDWQQELDQLLAAQYLTQHPEIDPNRIEIVSLIKDNDLYHQDDLLAKALAQMTNSPRRDVLPWASKHGHHALLQLIKANKEDENLFSAMLAGVLIDRELVRAALTSDSLVTKEIVATYLNADQPLTTMLGCLEMNLALAKQEQARLPVSFLNSIDMDTEIIYQLSASINVNATDPEVKSAISALVDKKPLPSLRTIIQTVMKKQAMGLEQLAAAIIEAIASSQQAIDKDLITTLVALLDDQEAGRGLNLLYEATKDLQLPFVNQVNQEFLENYYEENLAMQAALDLEPDAIRELQARQLEGDNPFKSFKQLTLSQVHAVIKLSNFSYKTIKEWINAAPSLEKFTKTIATLNHVARVALLTHLYAPTVMVALRRQAAMDARNRAMLLSWLINKKDHKIIASFINQEWQKPSKSLKDAKAKLNKVLGASNKRVDQQLLREINEMIDRLVSSSSNLDNQTLNDVRLVHNYQRANQAQLNEMLPQEIAARLEKRRLQKKAAAPGHKRKKSTQPE